MTRCHKGRVMNYFRTLGQILEDKAETDGDKVFLQYEEGKKVTGFYQLLDRSRKQISRLKEDLEQLEIFVRSFKK